MRGLAEAGAGRKEGGTSKRGERRWSRSGARRRENVREAATGLLVARHAPGPS